MPSHPSQSSKDIASWKQLPPAYLSLATGLLLPDRAKAKGGAPRVPESLRQHRLALRP